MSADAIITIHPESIPESYHSIQPKSKGAGVTVNTEEITDRPILRQDNTGLRNFLEKKPAQNVGYDGEVDTLQILGRIYRRILTYSIITRYAFYILPVAVVLSVPLIFFVSIKKDQTIEHVHMYGLFVWIEIAWCSLWFAKMCAKILPYLFRLCCGIISAGTRKHSLMIKALEVPISIILWIFLCWLTIPVIAAFDLDHVKVTVTSSEVTWIRILQKIFEASMAAWTVIFAEKLAIEFITVNYHRTQFAARIQASKRRMHLFEILYKASTILNPVGCKKFADEDFQISSTLLSTVGKGVQEVVDVADFQPVSISPTRFFDNIGRLGIGVTSVFGNIVSEVTGTRLIDSKSPHAVVSWALERKPSTEALARRVFRSLIAAGSNALYESDVERVLGHECPESVEEIFSALDKDGNGDVSEEEMTMMLLELAEGRRSMTKSLHDVDRAIKALDNILMIVAFIGMGMVYGAFFVLNFFKDFTAYTACIMSFSFAFAGTVTEFTSSCIFLFVKHPYDVGDRVHIKDQDLIVEHISLLYTVFHCVFSNVKFQMPNNSLNNESIENISRSQAMCEQFHLSISSSTTMHEIDGLASELEAFVSKDENRRDYQPDVKVWVDHVGNMTKLELKIVVGYKSNWSNEGLRSGRRSKFNIALLESLRKVNLRAPGGGD